MPAILNWTAPKLYPDHSKLSKKTMLIRSQFGATSGA